MASVQIHSDPATTASTTSLQNQSMGEGNFKRKLSKREKKELKKKGKDAKLQVCVCVVYGAGCIRWRHPSTHILVHMCVRTGPF